jgi:hypothetical protein
MSGPARARSAGAGVHVPIALAFPALPFPSP